MPTQTQQIREAVTVSDTVKYKVTINVIDKGDLPTLSLLIISINDETDSKEDTFARVATIADFTELLDDRADTIAADETLYRTASFTLYYDNLETANNAQKTLKEKIDELVDDYETYQDEFEAVVVETTVHPQVTESTYNAAVTAYQDALRDTLDAEEARDTAETAYLAKQAECVIATTDATKAQEITDDCTASKGYFDVLETAFITLDADGDLFLTAAQLYYDANPVDIAFQTALDTFRGKLQSAEAGKTTAAVNKGLFAVICDKRDTENNTAQTTKTTCDTEQAAAKTAFLDAQAAVEVATQAENAALAAVQALKPSFDPTSVEPTPAEV